MTNRGQTLIDEKAVEKIIQRAVDAVPGTTHVGMSLENPGGRSLPRYDITLHDVHQTVSVEAFIAVTWPAPTVDVAQRVEQNIRRWVDVFTGYAVDKVSIYVGAVEPGHQRVSTTELNNVPAPRPDKIHVEPHYSTAAHPEIKPHSRHLNSNAPLHRIAVTPHVTSKDVQSISTPQEHELRPITVASRGDVVTPVVVQEASVNVVVPEAPAASRVAPQYEPHAPKEFQAIAPRLPRAFALRPVLVRSISPHIPVRAPRAPQLRPVKVIRKEAPMHPVVPKPAPLKPFGVVDMTPHVPIRVVPFHNRHRLGGAR